MPPTTEHEVLGDLFRKHPGFAADLLRDLLGVELPDFHEARRESVDFTDIKPAPYFADVAVALMRKALDGERIPRQRRRRARKDGQPPPTSRAALGVLVEIQRNDDPGKRFSWPVYVSTFAGLLECPVILLVLCTSDRIGAWAAEPIKVGEPDFTLRPLVIGPSDIPKITDPEFAQAHPELAVLSARFRANGADGVFRAFAAALANIDPDDAKLYYHVVLDGLEPSARDLLKEELKTVTAVMRDDPRAARLQELVEGALAEGKAEGEAHGRAEGEAHGRAEGEAHGRIVALLDVLAARRVDLPEVVRDRIAASTDLDELARWIRRSATATTVEDLFD